MLLKSNAQVVEQLNKELTYVKWLYLYEYDSLIPIINLRTILSRSNKITRIDK